MAFQLPPHHDPKFDKLREAALTYARGQNPTGYVLDALTHLIPLHPQLIPYLPRPLSRLWPPPPKPTNRRNYYRSLPFIALKNRPALQRTLGIAQPNYRDTRVFLPPAHSLDDHPGLIQPFYSKHTPPWPPIPVPHVFWESASQAKILYSPTGGPNYLSHSPKMVEWARTAIGPHALHPSHRLP